MLQDPVHPRALHGKSKTGISNIELKEILYFLAKAPILGSRQAMARAEQAAYSERRTMGQRYEAVLKAAETGSFKEAARELGYTQAGVSYACLLYTSRCV